MDNRVKPNYGEALTRDEIVERVEDEERKVGRGEKAQKTVPVKEEPKENGTSRYIRQKPLSHMYSP